MLKIPPKQVAPHPSERGRARSDLDRRLVSGVAWTVGARWGGQIVSWASMLVLARLLSPGDFGLIGLTTIFLGLINVVSEFGIGTTIVVMTEMPASTLRQMHGVSLIMGLAGTAASVVAAQPLAVVFHDARLEAVMPVMGIGFILAGFRVVPQAVLMRDLRFKMASALEGAMAVFQAGASLALAWWGLGYWALVLGGLAGNAFGSLLFYVSAPSGIARPVFREMRAGLVFSWRVLVSRVAWYSYSNADFAVAGRVLGEATLGVYSMAWNLANIPVDRFASLLFRVTPSVLSKVQHDHAELRRYLGGLTEIISMVSFPFGLGFALVADPAVAVLFDARWAGLAMPLRLLALYAVVRCAYLPVFQMQNVTRDVSFAMWQSLAMLAVLPPTFYYAARWGGTGIAAAWLIAYPVLTAPVVVRMLSKIGMGPGEFFAALKPAGAASLAMTVTVLGLRQAVAHWSVPLQLLVETVAGAMAYVGILLIFFRPRLQIFLRLVLRRKQAAVT